MSLFVWGLGTLLFHEAMSFTFGRSSCDIHAGFVHTHVYKLFLQNVLCTSPSLMNQEGLALLNACGLAVYHTRRMLKVVRTRFSSRDDDGRVALYGTFTASSSRPHGSRITLFKIVCVGVFVSCAGAIPSTLGGLSPLKAFLLRNNQLTGESVVKIR